jgi:hypothetical protein
MILFIWNISPQNEDNDVGGAAGHGEVEGDGRLEKAQRGAAGGRGRAAKLYEVC